MGIMQKGLGFFIQKIFVLAKLSKRQIEVFNKQLVHSLVQAMNATVIASMEIAAMMDQGSGDVMS